MSDTVDPAEKDEVLTRLRRVEGQVRGIQRMIAEDRDCEAIVTQLMAARAALDRAGLYIMSHHIEHCLVDTSGHTDRARLDRIISFFMRFSGPVPSGPEGTSEPGADSEPPSGA